MTFNESVVVRDQSGRFGEKHGAAAEVSLSPESEYGDLAKSLSAMAEVRKEASRAEYRILSQGVSRYLRSHWPNARSLLIAENDPAIGGVFILGVEMRGKEADGRNFGEVHYRSEGFEGIWNDISHGQMPSYLNRLYREGIFTEEGDELFDNGEPAGRHISGGQGDRVFRFGAEEPPTR